MTVKDLRELLATLPDDKTILISNDLEHKTSPVFDVVEKDDFVRLGGFNVLRRVNAPYSGWPPFISEGKI